MSDVNKALRDVAYIAVGLGVLGFQKAQVRRREMARKAGDRTAVTTQIDEAREQLTELIRTLDERLVPVRHELEERLGDFEGRLPDQARELVRSVRLLARDAERQMRKLSGVA
jgi:ABC-type transporter Mla subunit MlaD